MMKFNMFGQPEEDQYPFAPQDPAMAPSPMALPTDQPQAPMQPEPLNPVVKDYLMSKRAPAAEQPPMPEMAAEPASEGAGFDFQAGIAGLGQAIAGKDPSGVVKAIKDRRIVDEERDGDMDPSSEQSLMAQQLASKLMPGKDFSKASAAQLKKVMPGLESLARLQSDEKNRAESRAERLNLAQIAAGDKQEARKEAKQTKLEAEQKKVDESSYRKNILDKNLNRLRELVDKSGTFELLGPESGEMDSLIYQAAVDYAKLVDPESVAREGEVASAKKYMLPIQGLTTRNSTAKKLIDQYQSGLNERMGARESAKGAATRPAGQSSGFPKTVRKGNQTATVSNEQELQEAMSEGFQ